MTGPGDGTANRWNADDYDDDHAFVFEYGDTVVDLLDPDADERILDLGCGTGHLTHRIATAGADVVGLDAAPEMVERARERYPDCTFVHGDARSFSFERPFDAVFSNAALHWIPDQDAVLESVADALVPGGRFVAELGGSGNVAAVVGAVRAEAADRGYDVSNPWYFPTVGEYATALEAHGLETRQAALFDRPTELDDGADGLADWLRMFGDGLLGPVPEEERSAVVAGVEERLRDEFYRDGTWTVDYRRLRVVAVERSR
jgi:trans-aconitate methyltransferase